MNDRERALNNDVYSRLKDLPMNAVAFGQPIMTICHDRANAQFILARHNDEFVIVKMAIPELNGVSEQFFGVIYRADNYDEALTRMRNILSPAAPRLVYSREMEMVD